MPLSTFRPGDKIDIKLIKAMNRIMLNSETVLIFKSSVFDIESDEGMKITMPTQAGRTILFPVGTEFSAVVYTRKGLFSIPCRVTKRSNENGLLSLDVIFTDKMKKFQRREFYRLSKIIDVSYFRVPFDENAEDLEEQYERAMLVQSQELKNGTIVDISGGGVRLLLSHSLEIDELIIVKFCLTDGDHQKLYQLMAQTIACSQSERIKDKYVIRLKFVALDKSIQDDLIKQIFVEERKLMKKKV